MADDDKKPKSAPKLKGDSPASTRQIGAIFRTDVSPIIGSKQADKAILTPFPPRKTKPKN